MTSDHVLKVTETIGSFERTSVSGLVVVDFRHGIYLPKGLMGVVIRSLGCLYGK